MNMNSMMDNAITHLIFHTFLLIQKKMHSKVFLYITENQKDGYVSKNLMLSKPPFLKTGYFVDENFDKLHSYEFILEDMIYIDLIEVHPLDKDLIKITNKGNDKFIDLMLKEKELKEQEEEENTENL